MMTNCFGLLIFTNVCLFLKANDTMDLQNQYHCITLSSIGEKVRDYRKMLPFEKLKKHQQEHSIT
jgi:hypothetical protein